MIPSYIILEEIFLPGPCLEPIHIASVLSKFTFKPEHSEKRDSTSNDFSNDWGLSSKIKSYIFCHIFIL